MTNIVGKKRKWLECLPEILKNSGFYEGLNDEDDDDDDDDEEEEEEEEEEELYVSEVFPVPEIPKVLYTENITSLDAFLIFTKTLAAFCTNDIHVLVSKNKSCVYTLLKLKASDIDMKIMTCIWIQQDKDLASFVNIFRLYNYTEMIQRAIYLNYPECLEYLIVYLRKKHKGKDAIRIFEKDTIGFYQENAIKQGRLDCLRVLLKYGG